MSKTRQQKEDTVGNLSELFKKMKSVVFTNFDNLTVKQADDLRAECRANEVQFVVAKKTLIKRGLEKAGFAEASKYDFSGGVASAFSLDDDTLGARIIKRFSKQCEGLKIIGGIFEGQFQEAKIVEKLGSLPGKVELQEQLTRIVASPVRGFMSVISGNMTKLLIALNTIKENKT